MIPKDLDNKTIDKLIDDYKEEKKIESKWKLHFVNKACMFPNGDRLLGVNSVNECGLATEKSDNCSEPIFSYSESDNTCICCLHNPPKLEIVSR